MSIGRWRLKPPIKIFRQIVFSLRNSFDPAVGSIKGQVVRL